MFGGKLSKIPVELRIEDTIIHEMIHYYIGYNRLEDASAHGPLFLSIMNEINRKFGRNLTVSHKSTKEQREQLQDKRSHYHVIAVVNFHDGRTGIKVLPRVLRSILYYYMCWRIRKDSQFAIHRMVIWNCWKFTTQRMVN